MNLIILIYKMLSLFSMTAFPVSRLCKELSTSIQIMQLILCLDSNITECDACQVARSDTQTFLGCHLEQLAGLCPTYGGYKTHHEQEH